MINQRWLRKILSKNLNKIANRRRHNKLCLERYFSYLKRLPSKQKSSFSYSSSYPPHMGWLSGDQVVARAEHCHHHSPGLAPLLALWQLQLGSWSWSWSSSSFSQNSAKNDLSYNWQPVTYFVLLLFVLKIHDNNMELFCDLWLTNLNHISQSTHTFWLGTNLFEGNVPFWNTVKPIQICFDVWAALNNSSDVTPGTRVELPE